MFAHLKIVYKRPVQQPTHIVPVRNSMLNLHTHHQRFYIASCHDSCRLGRNWQPVLSIMARFKLQSQGAYRPEVRLGPLGPELVGLVGNARLCDEHRPLQARKLSDGLHSMSQVVSKIYKPVMHPLMQVGPAPSSEHK